MAVLTEDQRVEVWEEFMRTNAELLDSLSKSDCRAPVDALDDWYQANQAMLNNVLPEPFKSQATTEQKAMLNIILVRKRYLADVGPFSI